MKKTIIILLFFIILFLSSCRSTFNYQYPNANLYTVGEATFSLTEVDKIVIDWLEGDIIIEGDNNQTKINISEEIDANTEDKFRMHYYLNNRVLDIKFMFSQKNATHLFIIKKLIVLLPSGFDKPIETKAISAKTDIKNINSPLTISSVSGTVNIDNTNTSTLDADLVSGQFNLSNSAVATIDIETVSGNITLSKVNLNDVTIKGVSSKVNIDFNNQATKCDINTVSGNIILTFPSANTFGFVYTSVSGEIACEFAVVIQNSLYIIGNSDNIYHFNTVTGSLNIKKK